MVLIQFRILGTIRISISALFENFINAKHKLVLNLAVYVSHPYMYTKVIPGSGTRSPMSSLLINGFKILASVILGVVYSSSK